MCLPAIILLEKEIPHNDIISLYQRWEARLEHESALEAGQELLGRLSELENITSKHAQNPS